MRRVSASRLRAASRGVIGAGLAVAIVVGSGLVASRGRGHAAPPSRAAEHLRIQRRVTALFVGIHQHGVVLGQPTAPVTLQVFIDLEDHQAGYWVNVLLPAILEKFVRTNVVRIEFHSYKSDTLNRIPFYRQQVAALAAGKQDLLWNYVATFLNEQGTAFTNYATAEFDAHIAERVPRLNLSEWELASTVAMEESVAADLVTARRAGFYVSPSFRIGLTDGLMRDLFGSVIFRFHKYIVHTTPSGERYISGTSSQWQHPTILVNASDLKKAVEGLV
jgi:protein-disulfide isomerase